MIKWIILLNSDPVSVGYTTSIVQKRDRLPVFIRIKYLFVHEPQASREPEASVRFLCSLWNQSVGTFFPLEDLVYDRMDRLDHPVGVIQIEVAYAQWQYGIETLRDGQDDVGRIIKEEITEHDIGAPQGAIASAVFKESLHVRLTSLDPERPGHRLTASGILNLL